jgi:hypothetical protein
MHRALRAMESEAKARSPRRRRCERIVWPELAQGPIGPEADAGHMQAHAKRPQAI